MKKRLTKERMAELIQNFSNEEFIAFCDGINQISYEYGWKAGLSKNEVIQGSLYVDPMYDYMFNE